MTDYRNTRRYGEDHDYEIPNLHAVNYAAEWTGDKVHIMSDYYTSLVSLICKCRWMTVRRWRRLT